MENNFKPGPVEGGVVGGLGFGAIFSLFYSKWAALIIFVLLVLLIGGYFAVMWWRGRRRQRALNGVMKEEGRKVSMEIANKAKLKELQEKFEEGVRLYRKKGKDLYSVPWYVVIGGPGTGKTMAIRAADICSKELSKEREGVGGTLNMNWWFTNHGVILDTAGNMVFPETKDPTKTSEWDHFLQLVKKYRPNCPINGMFLVFSAEDLIRESADKIRENGVKIKDRLDRIREVLKIRFPIYILITKSDMLEGFREFSDECDDPDIRHQILGWSNPDPLDEPFRADRVGEHLGAVADGVRQRIRGIIRRPMVLELKEGNRANATSALYAFPDSLERLGERLQRYLEIICTVGGVWDEQPPFIRGFYFTSALREGTTLDEGIAEALGVHVDQLSKARSGEDDETSADRDSKTLRPFFIRDVLIKKAFPEYSLVTDAGNIRQRQRFWRYVLAGTSAFALLLLLGGIWLGYRGLRESIGKEKAIWMVASTNFYGASGFWNPIVEKKVSDAGNAYWVYRGNEPSVVLEGNKMTINEFHALLQERAGRDLDVSWVFRPAEWMRSSRGLDRVLAHRVLVELGIMRPLLENTRRKMPLQAASVDPQRHLAALTNLIQVEVVAASRAKGARYLEPNLDGPMVGNWINACVNYLVDSNCPADDRLSKAVVWSYSSASKRTPEWPPRFPNFSGGTNLNQNAAIDAGLDRFISGATKMQDQVLVDLATLSGVCEAASNALAAEEEIHRACEKNVTPSPEAYQRYEETSRRLAELMVSDAAVKLFREARTNLLVGCLQDLRKKNEQSSDQAFGPVRAMVRTAEGDLFQQILVKLAQVSGRVDTAVKGFESRYALASLAEWETPLFTMYESRRAYEYRRDVIGKLVKIKAGSQDAASIVGLKWTFIDSMLKELDDTMGVAANYRGPWSEKLLRTATFYVEPAKKKVREEAVKIYSAAVLKLMEDWRLEKTPDLKYLEKVRLDMVKVEDDLKPESYRGKIFPADEAQLRKLADSLAVIKTDLIKAYLEQQKTLAEEAFALKFERDQPAQALLKFRTRLSDLEKELASDTLKFYPQEQLLPMRDIMADAKKVAVGGYLAFWKKDMTSKLGFPLVRDGVTAMEVEDIKLLSKRLAVLQLELAAKEMDYYKGEDLARLQQRKDSLQQIISVVYPKNEWAKYTISNSTKWELGIWRYVAINDNPAHEFTVSKQKLAAGELFVPLRIKVAKLGNLAGAVDKTMAEPWAVIRLLFETKAKRDAGGRNWEIALPVSEGDLKQKVFFDVEFDEALPDLKEWPSIEDYR
jgi:hypothetical protein